VPPGRAHRAAPRDTSIRRSGSHRDTGRYSASQDLVLSRHFRATMRERNGVSASGFTSVAGIMLARIYCMPHPNCASSIALALALALAASPCGAVTVSAPYLVKDIIPEDSEGYQLTHMTGVGDTLFFVTGGKEKVLWKSDGTAAGTVPVADVAGNWEFQDPTSFGDILVFEGPGGLWRSDGTKIGTHFIATVWPYGEDRWESPPMIVREGTLFVAGCGPNRTCGLWRSDGTPEGTMLVQQGFGSEIAPFRGGLIGSSAFWTSDGTAEGARRISLSYLEAVRAAGEDLAIFTRSTRYSSTRRRHVPYSHPRRPLHLRRRPLQGVPISYGPAVRRWRREVRGLHLRRWHVEQRRDCRRDPNACRPWLR